MLGVWGFRAFWPVCSVNGMEWYLVSNASSKDTWPNILVPNCGGSIDCVVGRL